ncbi:MAG: PDZ domain-containing protein [Bacteroidales bacterium]|nr:PDZ domain-containing protein [Bacteroidales bacterium]
MTFKNKGLGVYLPVIIAVSIVIGILLGRFYRGSTAESKFIIIPKANKLDNVLNYIENEYVDEVSKTAIIESAIPKILQELDPHSQYIPAADLQKVNEPLEGNFSGIGIQFNMLDDTLVVIQTTPNGPSQKVGILAGDRIIRVDSIHVAGQKLPSDSIVNRLRGPRGTHVLVEVSRRNVDELLSFDIIRDNIPLNSVDAAYMIGDGIGYIKLNKFSATTEAEFVENVNRLRANGLQKLILDLRENGGGYMNAAVFIADQFLNGNEMIVYTQGKARERQDFSSNPGGLCTDLGIAILIDENSASASEILAGAIQDNDRGVIIGRRSFGKGLVQEQKSLADGSAIRLTIARYYTPTGRSIQRPYNNDIIDYYSELNERFLHGELENADSNKFADSLKYITPAGKTVFGGGGIMPDIFVPIDTIGITDYFIDIRNKGLIYRFSLSYSDENREMLSKLNSANEFIETLEKQKILRRFVAFAAKEGVKEVPGEITISEKIIKSQLYAYVARNFIGDNGFYQIIERIDTTLQKAVEVVKEQ